MNWLVLILLIPGGLCQNGRVGQPFTNSVRPCDGKHISTWFKMLLTPRNQYTLDIPGDFRSDSDIVLKFDSTTYRLEARERSTANLAVFEHPSKINFGIYDLAIPKNSYHIHFYQQLHDLAVQVYGPPDTGTLPYIQSVIYNGEEFCQNPTTGYFDYQLNIALNETTEIAVTDREALDESCGRRKVVHTELIVHGQPTKPGDWPWHVAILRVDNSYHRYICGGTLLSKTLVLTAAHCTCIGTSPVIPDSLTIELGKYNLKGADIASQTREVFEVIIHPRFDLTLNNDIAVLKLRSEAVLTDHVQPACLWPTNSKFPTEDVVGTVVGWGFNHLDQLSSTLQQVTIPIASELDCLKSNPSFFHKKLNTNKFCAGFANGTSVCNGDSGGGLMVFVPDTPGDKSQRSGAWYIRGIVSLAPSIPNINICDPDQYTIFTDVDRYRGWLSTFLF